MKLDSLVLNRFYFVNSKQAKYLKINYLIELDSRCRKSSENFTEASTSWRVGTVFHSIHGHLGFTFLVTWYRLSGWDGKVPKTLLGCGLAGSQDKEGCYSRQDRLRATHSLVLLLFAILFTNTGYKAGQISFHQLFTSINKNGTTFTVSCYLILRRSRPLCHGSEIPYHHAFSFSCHVIFSQQWM